jgi:hypothetical protein
MILPTFSIADRQHLPNLSKILSDLHSLDFQPTHFWEVDRKSQVFNYKCFPKPFQPTNPWEVDCNHTQTVDIAGKSSLFQPTNPWEVDCNRVAVLTILKGSFTFNPPIPGKSIATPGARTLILKAF